MYICRWHIIILSLAKVQTRETNSEENWQQLLVTGYKPYVLGFVRIASYQGTYIDTYICNNASNFIYCIQVCTDTQYVGKCYQEYIIDSWYYT